MPCHHREDRVESTFPESPTLQSSTANGTSQTTPMTSDKPRVFLSSVFVDDFGSGRGYVPLRKRIIEESDSLPVHLWAYEHFWPKNSELPEPDADTVVDRCFRGVKECDLFVFLLTGRHGSGVGYDSDPVLASYLELELFAAAMLDKPTLVLHLYNKEPQDELKDAMLLLRSAHDQYVIDDEDGLYRQFMEACDSLAGGTLLAQSQKLAGLAEWLSLRRSRQRMDEELSNPLLHFLDGRLFPDKKNINPAKAGRLLDQVASGHRLVGTDMLQMPHGAALCRLWAAMRELMNDKGTAISDPSIAPLWDRALGLWAGKAAWFGLHGHVWMGPLAAVNSQLALRRGMQHEPAFRSAQDVREPLGGRASAIYSVAHRMYSRKRKLYHYNQTIRLSTRAIERDVDAQQGARAIRGYAFMQTARLGKVWNIWRAKHDFKRSLELREKAGAEPSSIGEAKADLGLCLVLLGSKGSGLSLLQEGIELLRKDDSVNVQSFLAQGLRKLERAATLSGKHALAESAHSERVALSSEIDAFDQARDA